MIDGCYRFSFDGDCRDAALHTLFHDFVGVPRVNGIVRWCSSGYINRLEWNTSVEDAGSCCRRRFAVCMDFGQARAFIEAIFSQTGDGVGNRDAGQSRATREATISQTGDGVGNRGARQARAVTEFASRFISTTCVLNSRKMSTWILWRTKRMKI